ncbi:hypothetical protein SISNIDRAFT_546856 [Sistotremastrum niveocremeum HHB9708]|uniref:Uncharacterized protein n=1 Tax=Sistotremastrum niveocremeum HHB9708 TaxID=1314777 RepID=A0A164ZK91_9AGAM|nr:hypothetical protein SISNIDRAFT_546856 [Sistotremastrum niveocremeum HHB9708]
MRTFLSLALSTLLVVANVAQAQYMSEGWKPGQPVPSNSLDSAKAAYTPSKESSKTGGSLFDVTSLITSGPLGALLSRSGVNVTERLEQMKAEIAKLWDPRITMITDDNYEDLVVREVLTEEEELDRIWLIIISVTAAQKDGISSIFDKKFDEAYNMTLEAGDLPEVRWARIDYMNVTRVTTKWNVWRGPMLVVASNRGQTLRFYSAQALRPNPELMRNWLLEKRYLDTPPWSSIFAPGGKREFLLDWFSIGFQKFYDYTTMIPRWLFLVLTGTLGSLLLNLMHSKPKPKAQKKSQGAKPVAAKPAASPAPAAASTATTPASSPAKKRKNGRK